jgi:hypothetical protein
MIKIESYGKSRVAAGMGRSAITTAILSAQTQRTVHNTETSFGGGLRGARLWKNSKDLSVLRENNDPEVCLFVAQAFPPAPCGRN